MSVQTDIYIAANLNRSVECNISKQIIIARWKSIFIIRGLLYSVSTILQYLFLAVISQRYPQGIVMIFLCTARLTANGMLVQRTIHKNNAVSY